MGGGEENRTIWCEVGRGFGVGGYKRGSRWEKSLQLSAYMPYNMYVDTIRNSASVYANLKIKSHGNFWNLNFYEFFGNSRQCIWIMITPTLPRLPPTFFIHPNFFFFVVVLMNLLTLICTVQTFLGLRMPTEVWLSYQEFSEAINCP